MKRLRSLLTVLLLAGCAVHAPGRTGYPFNPSSTDGGCTGQGTLTLTDGAMCAGVPCGPAFGARRADGGTR